MATPRYSSIFNFLQNPQMQSGGGGTVTPGFLSAYGDPGSWAYTPSMYGRGAEGWQYTAPDAYKDILSVRYDPGSGEDPKDGYVSSIDWSKLPNQGNTSLGHVGTLMAIGGPDSKKLKDPSLITFDENYGWVTPQSNYAESNMEALSPYLAMLGGTALFGGAALGAAGLGAEAGGAAAGGMAAGEGGMLGPGLTSYLDLIAPEVAAGGSSGWGNLAGADWGGAQAGAGPAWVNTATSPVVPGWGDLGGADWGGAQAGSGPAWVNTPTSPITPGWGDLGGADWGGAQPGSGPAWVNPGSGGPGLLSNVGNALSNLANTPGVSSLLNSLLGNSGGGGGGGGGGLSMSSGGTGRGFGNAIAPIPGTIDDGVRMAQLMRQKQRLGGLLGGGGGYDANA